MAQIFALSETDRTEVSAAVSAAEAKSAGEIVTIMAESSDTYHDVALWWSAFAVFVALAVLAWAAPTYLSLIDRITGAWQADWNPARVMALALFIASAKFLGAYLLLLWQPLRLALVPSRLKHKRVRARAVTSFKIGAERRTHGRTGVLIYLSLAERRAEIVADEAIAAPQTSGETLAAIASSATISARRSARLR